MRKSEIPVRRALLLILLLSLFTGCKRGSVGGGSDTLTGVWNTTFSTPMGQISSQLIVKDDGTYQKMDQMMNSGFSTLISGKYQVVSGQNLLRLNIEHGEPTQTCGPLGCDPIVYPAAESYGYSFPANNTLQLQGVGCDPSLCTYIYKRGM